MIYTSYYANPDLPKYKNLISISRIKPHWFDCGNALELAPSSDLLFKYKNGEVSEGEYEKIYLKQLNQLDSEEIYERYNESVLLCYEKRGDFCHRNILAKWLKENNKKVEELSKSIKIAVIGSRDFNDYNTLCYLLDKFLNKYTNVSLVSGGANGADKLAERYAAEKNVKIKILPADWDKHGKAAGFIRNKEIWDNSDLGIAFWDGESKGTKHSFQLSFDQNKDLYIFNYKKRCFVPRIIKSDILKHQDKYDYIAFTANSEHTKTKKLVMGAGNAKSFKNSFKGIDNEFGMLIDNESLFGIEVVDNIIAFQSKIRWRENSTLNIIKYSIENLKTFILNNRRKGRELKIGLCFPGISNGGLNETDVYNLFEGISIDLFKLK